ncbi:MAG TPA: hypothetical protein VLA88_02940 [Candidatus Saccharimonadales bacterium]|nr:hypothetical protein [Candidatus Saccharimonadales bacterium]
MIVSITRALIRVAGGGNAIERACRAHDTRCQSGGKPNEILESVYVACPTTANAVRWRVFPVESPEFGHVVLLVNAVTGEMTVLDDLANCNYLGEEERRIMTLCANGVALAKMDPTRTADAFFAISATNTSTRRRRPKHD